MEDYFYPDVNDSLTTALVKEHEPFPGYWDRSEQFILDQVKIYIQKKIPREGSSMLDVGCGQGRLIFEFQDFFETIHAIEPDVKRMEGARVSVESKGLSNRVSFESISIEELGETRKFDMILCSHIIQHVHTDQLPTIFGKFKKLLKNEGLLIILTSHSRKKYDTYIKQWSQNSEVLQEQITKEEFNRLTRNELGVLPHHRFSIQNLLQMSEEVNLRVVKTTSFHILDNFYGIDRLINRDKLINSFPFFKSRFGSDIMVLAENMPNTRKKP
jgi:cyclopropane fatty-acyl-phospholipid synthase-like methyltransferase